jgi:hypothetical protein
MSGERTRIATPALPSAVPAFAEAEVAEPVLKGGLEFLKEFPEFSSTIVEASQKRLRAARDQLGERRPPRGWVVTWCPAFSNLRATREATLPVAPTKAIFIMIHPYDLPRSLR